MATDQGTLLTWSLTAELTKHKTKSQVCVPVGHVLRVCFDPLDPIIDWIQRIEALIGWTCQHVHVTAEASSLGKQHDDDDDVVWGNQWNWMQCDEDAS